MNCEQCGLKINSEREQDGRITCSDQCSDDYLANCEIASRMLNHINEETGRAQPDFMRDIINE